MSSGPGNVFRAHTKKYSDLKYGFPLYCSIELVRNRMSTILFYQASSQLNVLVIDVDPFININKYERKIKCSD